MAEDKTKDEDQSIDKKVLHSEDGIGDDLTPGSAAENEANQTKHGGTAAGTELLLQMDEDGDAEEEKETARRSEDKSRDAEQSKGERVPDDYPNEFKDNG